MPTETIPDAPIIRGHDFQKGRDLDSIMDSMLTTGFQATTFGQAINEVNRMVGGWGSLPVNPPPPLQREPHCNTLTLALHPLFLA